MESKKTGFESVEKPKVSNLKKEHLKWFNAKFFLTEEVIF